MYIITQILHNKHLAIYTSTTLDIQFLHIIEKCIINHTHQWPFNAWFTFFEEKKRRPVLSPAKGDGILNTTWNLRYFLLIGAFLGAGILRGWGPKEVLAAHRVTGLQYYQYSYGKWLGNPITLDLCAAEKFWTTGHNNMVKRRDVQ